MDVFRFLVNQDNKLREDQHQEEIKSSFSLEKFKTTFPVVSSIFCAEMGVTVIVGSPSDNNKETQPKSLAQQLRDEAAAEEDDKQQKMKSRGQEQGTQQEQKTEEKNKSDESETSVIAQTNNILPSGRGGGGAGRGSSGYAPRGRRGRGTAMPQPRQNSDEYDEDQQHQANEIFPPSLLSDFKKSVRVDSNMPVASERAFHSVMNCVFSSVLLKDRPYLSEEETGNGVAARFQECAEKSVAFYCDKLAWKCHKNLFLVGEQDDSDEFLPTEVAVFLPVSFSQRSLDKEKQDDDEDTIIIAKTIKLLKTIRAFLVPFSFGPFASVTNNSASQQQHQQQTELVHRQSSWRHLTRVFTSIDDETSVKLCKCQQIAGRLENFRWQVFRKVINYFMLPDALCNNNNRGDTSLQEAESDVLRKVLDSVFLYWDPLSVMKRNFPLVFNEWFGDENKSSNHETFSMEDLKEMIKSPQNFLSSHHRKTNNIKEKLCSPMSVAFAKLFADSYFAGSLRYKAILLAKDQENNKKTAKLDDATTGVEEGEEDKDAIIEQIEEVISLKIFANEVLYLREAGFPKSIQTAASSSTNTVSHSYNEHNNEDDNDNNNNAQGKTSKSISQNGDGKSQESQNQDSVTKLVSLVMRWWSVLLKEQCPVCCVKVY